ncbi:MAG: NADH-quinone oxidoreductase subunit C [Deltaproteobacteria bacterium]|nr:NADH-quinone oxidoreductase subunit C [Deltaproteobacteria bacterium]
MENTGLKEAVLSGIGAEAAVVKCLRPGDVVCLNLPSSRFAEAAGLVKAVGGRLVSEWAVDETAFKKGFAVYACYAKGPQYLLVNSRLPEVNPAFPSIARKFTSANRFERKINCLMGVTPSGHPDLRPWILHEDWPEGVYPLRKFFDPKSFVPRVDGRYAWIQASGEEVHEIPVGPVHAGIIEPGHFRFQAAGEAIINLEERLGYAHKGIEKRFEAMSFKDGVRLAARVSGDSTVAHSTAYAMAIEALSGITAPPRAMWLRGIMIELERLANHLNDIGAICNDTAFSFMLYQFSRLREYVLRACKEVFGHRLMMDTVIAGGVCLDIDRADTALILKTIGLVSSELERLIAIYDDNPSLEDRIYTTGILRQDIAKDLGAVGFAARASGVPLDVRLERPFPPYDIVRPLPIVLDSGDVHARAWVRVMETRDSIRMIKEMLEGLTEGPVSAEFDPHVQPDEAGFSSVEGWRGEIIYWVQSGPANGINRCMVRDPSFVNWLCVEQSIKGNIVPDFPLINKSFNQSYSGNDL